ncbi:MAG TPA: hypothetical protein VNV41_10805 [Candidatus Acidoferrales bacterium]|jgi:hypothetical protein|nr:hypothetical protein [Candidatus Acidoferrales bacterium]
MSNPALFKTLYRILSWGAAAGLVLTLGLVLRKSPSPDVANDPAAASRAEQKFAAADQAKADGQPAQVQLDSTELNSYLQQNLQTGGASQPSTAAPVSSPGSEGVPVAASPRDPNAGPMAALSGDDDATLEQVQSSVKDVQVDMDGDLVKAHVIFNFHGKDLSLELDGHLGSQDGYIKFVPVAGKLGSLPLPQSMLDAAVAKMMASPENREKLKLPSDINDIQVQDGKAVVSYK